MYKSKDTRKNNLVIKMRIWQTNRAKSIFAFKNLRRSFLQILLQEIKNVTKSRMLDLTRV